MRILQFGTGVFIRGFFDWMLQELSERTELDPQVTIVKLTEHGDLSQYEAQNGQFHVLLRGLENGRVVDELKKIDRVSDFIHPYEQWDEFLVSAEDPSISLVVSNSTEAGLAYEKTPCYGTCPASFPAKLYQWLKKRFEHLGEAGSLTLMAFELVPDNASKLKEILLKLAADDKASEEFIHWLSESCHYVNTLVDRIVSKLPAEDVERLQNEFGVQDQLMVCAEPYHLLAVDSPSLENILPLNKAGLNVQLSEDLDAVRDKKVKVLNGAHMLLVPAGLAMGKQIVLETLEDPRIRNFAQECLQKEIAVTVSDPEIDAYIACVIERFENPFLNHRLENIALNSSAKIGQRLFPSIVDYYRESGRFPEKLLTAVAVYLEFYQGELISPGKLKTAWGYLFDNSEAMAFLLSLHEKEEVTAAKTIAEKSFWEIPEDMRHAFAEALGKSWNNVRSNGIKNSL